MRRGLGREHQPFAIQANVVAGRGAAAELGNAAVHGQPAGADPVLDEAAGA